MIYIRYYKNGIFLQSRPFLYKKLLYLLNIASIRLMGANERKLRFDVSARTAKLIGMENFSNAEGAIIELVKNTYDADASHCSLVFDIKETPANSAIYIIDNGCGMTEDVIAKHWMKIGTDNKLKDSLSPKGRVKSGAKGIGRFALNRLGRHSEMYTFFSDSNNGIYWDLDWAAFDTHSSLSEISALIKDVTHDELPDIVQEEGISKLEVFQRIDLNKYQGTIIKISHLNDLWDEKAISSLNSNLENLIPDHLGSDFSISLNLLSMPYSFGRVKSAYYDDYDYRIEAEYCGKGQEIAVRIHRNELNVSLLESKYKDVFKYDAMVVFPYRLEDFKQNSFVINIPIKEDISKDLLNRIGAFKFVFYYVKNTINDESEREASKKYPYNSINSAERKKWIKKFGGIKIYRDDFRVRPYGENGDDWLGLGERQGRSPGGPGQKLGGYRIRPNQISGTVYISRINNPYFEDKSSREGIQENDEFLLFKNLLITIIEAFETDRNTIMFYLSQLYKAQNPNSAKAKIISESITAKQAENGNIDNDELTTLALGYSELEEEIHEKNEELRLLRALASSGIAVTSFAHELQSLSKRLTLRTKILSEILDTYFAKDQFVNIDIYDNPYYHISIIEDEDKKLRQWLTYTLNTIKKDKRERINIDINDYFHRFHQLWYETLKRKSINLILPEASSIPINAKVRAFEMDLDSIFNNFVSNSVRSLLNTRLNNKTISINWKVDKDFIIIDFEDNGGGLAYEYQNKPDVIFNAFETSTTDKNGEKIGTGMGLYIAKSIIDDYKDASITITKILDGFGIRVIFRKI